MTKYTLQLLALLLLLLLSAQPCLSEVILTDEEAQAIQESLEISRETLSQSEEKLTSLETKSEEQKNLYQEQTTYLNRQLKEVKTERNIFATCTVLEAIVLIFIVSAPYLL